MADVPDVYVGFRKQIGYTLIIAAVLYGVLVTLLLVFFGTTITSDQMLWGFINTVVSTMLGWLLAKASTIIDNVWGTSQSSERKTEIMANMAKAATETATDAAKTLAATEAAEDSHLTPAEITEQKLREASQTATEVEEPKP